MWKWVCLLLEKGEGRSLFLSLDSRAHGLEQSFINSDEGDRHCSSPKMTEE
jgi:hypothetical protein